MRTWLLMENDFVLPVSFEGSNLELPGRLRQFGYTVRIEVEIEGTVVVFEPDEERNWRAIMGFEDLINGKNVKRGLLEAIASVIEEYTK